MAWTVAAAAVFRFLAPCCGDFRLDRKACAEFIEKIDTLTMEQVVEAAKKLTAHTIYFLRGEGENDE